jgi:aspartyl-tRNA(Asn)/glutamyl-tRNA(Gln) amidotransferase subunit C
VKVDRDLVARIAHLAQIELAEDEIPFYESQMRDLLGFVDEIQVLNIKPEKISLQTSVPGIPVEREDVIAPSLPFEFVTVNAPAASGTAFRVPRIVEN